MSFKKIIIPLGIVIIAIICIFGYLSIQDRNDGHAASNNNATTENRNISENITEVHDSQSPAIPSSPSLPAGADTFSGSVPDGYPDGIGTYVFGSERRIDMHDERGRVASPGDYIVGEWSRGHLIQGKWYGSDGKEKEVIIIGNAPNPGADHVFDKCYVKR